MISRAVAGFKFARCFLVLTASLALLHSAAAEESLSNAVSVARARVTAELVPKVPGLSIAVAHDGKLIWSECFGFADLEAKRPVTKETLFRIGSVSKPLTAAGLMLLVEKGKLDLDADIHRYLPDYPDKGHAITARELAGHLAGIRHYRGREFYLNTHYTSVRASLKIFEDDALLSVPGEKFNYSSYGYNLLSAVMEGPAQTNFPAYMGANIFQPLRMKNTMADDVTRALPDRTEFYKAKPGGGFEREPAVDNSYKWASGGFLSTPEDLVRFGSAHLHEGFLKRSSLDAMFTSQQTTDGTKTKYGIGWGTLVGKKKHHVVAHSGGAVGGTSLLMVDLDARTVLAVTANCTGAPFDKANPAQILELFADFFPAK